MKVKKAVQLILLAVVLTASSSLAPGQRGAHPLPENRCVNPNKLNTPLTALIPHGTDDGLKTPLILIHGIHGTDRNQVVTVRNDSWSAFRSRFEGESLSKQFALYYFQYCSNREPVSKIAEELRDKIDAELRGRSHLIVAHSMGGLVAKYYMVNTYRGNAPSGDSVMGLITLATPHHGTHGANATGSFSRYVSLGWAVALNSVNFLYWMDRSGQILSPPGISSQTPNRSDLLWDNYDNSIDGNDVNLWLSPANKRFDKFASKTILYGGFTNFENRIQEPHQVIGGAVGTILPWISDDHKRLRFANDLLKNGYRNKFGNTDGLVPFSSALLCDPPPYLTSASDRNFFCISKFSVRRFEAGSFDALKNELPQNTRSIKRRPTGYDHRQMYEDPDVLITLISDLKSFLPSPVFVSSIPTLFLFDVSGSMSENNKIEQARAAGLDALREMRDEGAGSSPVSVMTFAGDCSPASAKRLMTFAPNLGTAENVMRRMLPSPEGATPLPQAKDAAFGEVTKFLDSNPAIKEGRVILLSDGQSTCGEIRPPGVFSRQNIVVTGRPTSRVRYFTIGFDVPAGSAAERDLQYLASQTGGKYYNAKNREQLIRSLQKQVRVFVPRACNSTDPDFARGLTAFKDYDYAAAVEAFRKYTSVTPSDWCGFYNLALAYEATDRYKKAAQNFQKYLDLAPTSPDRAKIELRISRLRQDYAYQFGYLVDLIESDVGYLKNYYQSIFNRSSSELAEEFGGFVYEKREFYAMLPDILEIEERWLINDSKDIASSIDVLARRRSMESFDRDAVSLLTLPIAQMQDLTARLRQHQAGQF